MHDFQMVVHKSDLGKFRYHIPDKCAFGVQESSCSRHDLPKQESFKTCQWVLVGFLCLIYLNTIIFSRSTTQSDECWPSIPPTDSTHSTKSNSLLEDRNTLVEVTRSQGAFREDNIGTLLSVEIPETQSTGLELCKYRTAHKSPSLTTHSSKVQKFNFKSSQVDTINSPVVCTTHKTWCYKSTNVINVIDSNLTPYYLTPFLEQLTFLSRNLEKRECDFFYSTRSASINITVPGVFPFLLPEGQLLYIFLS